LEEILQLRLKASAISYTAVLPVMRLSEQALELILSKTALKLEEGFDNAVIPLNIEGKHWVGLLVRAGAKRLDVEYLDPEQNGLSLTFKERILSYFKGMDVKIVESIFERQKYNNCGPELIENFIKLLGGKRVPQEAAPYLHSWLLEQKLIEDVKEEGKSPALVETVKPLLQKSDIIFIENKLPITNIESTTNQEKATYYTYSSSISSVFTNLISKLLDKLDLSWQYKKVLYHQDITKFAQILKDNNIDKSIDVLQDHSELKKSVLIKLHPDKGGSNEDFAFVKGLEEKLSEQIDINRLLREKVQQVQPYVYKVSLGFKALDMAVDAMRALHEPTVMHAKKAVADAAHLYGMRYGFNGFSMAISLFDSGCSAYQGNYSTAVQQLATTAFYMGLPKAMGHIGIPYLGFAYSIVMVAYSGYSALANLYSFYNGYDSEDSKLKTATAYKEVLEFLGETPFKWLYDFSSIIKSYQVKINNLSLIKEKQFYEGKLREEKGELGEKLYIYVYKSLIEEKYDLLNRVIQGEITEEEVENLRLKQIKITVGSKVYDNCVEVRNINQFKNNKEDYRCYNEDQGHVEYVSISDSMFEILEIV
jgi:hypothetical protein